MKRIILCEGKTDAILISYFLEKCFGWSYASPKETKKYHNILPRFPVDPDNEEFNWYQCRHKHKPEELLAIWGVGGITNLPKRLNDLVDYNRRLPQTGDENRFGHIVLFLDHDESLEILHAKVRTWIEKSGLMIRASAFQFGQWLPVDMALVGVTPARRYTSNLLVAVVPPDTPGALERFLIECWKQFSETDAQLAEAAQAFIQELPSLPREKYLKHRRLVDKACLSSIFSVVSPDRIFDELHPRLQEIPWDRLPDMLDVYGKLSVL